MKPSQKEIKISRIAFTRSNNFREDYNDKASTESSGSLENLKESIKTLGLLYPLRVKELDEPDANGKMYQVSDGHRRLEALHSLVENDKVLNADNGTSLEVVSCLVMPASMGRDIDIATQVAVNTQQERWKPIEVAKAIKATLDSGKTIEEVMSTFGIKSKQSIETKLKLLEAPQILQDAVENGLAFSAAAEILRIKDPAIQEQITKQAVEGDMSIGDVRAAIETAADVAEATTGEKIKQRRKRKTKDGEIKERRKNMRPPEEVITHLSTLKDERSKCEDITTANKLDGWIAALSWVMTPKAEFIAHEPSKKVAEEMDELLKELGAEDDSPPESEDSLDPDMATDD